MTAWYVRVDEVRMLASADGTRWWHDYRSRQAPGRMTDLLVTVAGAVTLVACDSREHADELIATMIQRGIPRTALKRVKEVRQ